MSAPAPTPRGLALAIGLLRALCGAIGGMLLFGAALVVLWHWRLPQVSGVVCVLAFLKGRTTAAIAGALVGVIVGRALHRRRTQATSPDAGAVRVVAARALARHVGARRVRDLALVGGTLLLVIALGLLAADSLGFSDAAGGLTVVVPLAAIGARLLFTRG